MVRWILIAILVVSCSIHVSAVTKPPLLPAAASLRHTYYLNSCPNLESIIQQKVSAWVEKDYTLAASIIRLHFHDCAVRVCRSSIHIFQFT